ncbi:MAG: hypothetical protein FWD71_16730 [Oscillospiraceae bacterium]|nr:hypothetical protein [Oscillospiraceae bacterium]
MKNLNISGKAIIKLYINQIAMSAFSIMVIMASSKSDLLVILASILSIGLYLFIIYSMMWDEGAKVAARTLRAEDSGARKILTPFLLVLFGSIFNIVCAVVYAVLKIYVAAGNITEGYSIFCGNLFMTIMQFTNAMYMGFSSLLFPNPNVGLPVGQAVIPANMLVAPYYYFIIIIPLFIVGMAAYYLGASEISVMKKLGFKTKSKSR